MTRRVLFSLLLASRLAAAPGPDSPPVFTEDVYSYARPAEVRVEHLDLDLTVDFAKKELAGTATLRLVRGRTDAATLTLDDNGLVIRGVTLLPSGTSARFTLGPVQSILGTKLEIALTPDTTAVAISYHTIPEARALQWLAPAMTAGKKHPFLLSQSESILARTWIPLQDSPQVRFTYDATVRGVPPELLALMSAENTPRKAPDGVYHFRMAQPVPSYLLAIAIGDLEFHPFDERSGIYAEPPVLAAAAWEFAETPRMIAAAEKLYGPYRWGRYDLLVLPPSFPYGGMENPRLTFVTPTVIAGDRSLVDLVAHELAHSWSGNLVTNATWSDFWLNEGFTDYFEHRIMEELVGRERSETIWLNDLFHLRKELAEEPPGDQHLYVELGGRDPDDAPDSVYGKGAIFQRLLEETAGREKWDRFLHGYFDAHAFQSMTTAGFLAALQAALPEVARQAGVREWVYGPGLPANCPQPRSRALARVEAAAARFASGAAATTIEAKDWSTQERVHFIGALPKLTPARMGELDAAFHFSQTGNYEVLYTWLLKSVDDHYTAARPAIERFLTSQGRGRFVEPMYKKLAKDPADLALARRIYRTARPSYHPVVQSAVDALLQ